MLQQTQVKTVIPYFKNFIKKFKGKIDLTGVDYSPKLIREAQEYNLKSKINFEANIYNQFFQIEKKQINSKYIIK